MKIENNKYYVNKMLDVLYSETLRPGLLKMTPLDYIKKRRAYTVTEDGFYNASTQPYKKDIAAKIEDNARTKDILILDLFQLADYTLDKVYTTAKNSNSDIRINCKNSSMISIYNRTMVETYDYPIVSTGEALGVLNKLSKLNKALEE